MSYSFGIPSFVIYSTHIIVGLYFVFLGYLLMNSVKFRLHSIILIGLGVLMFFYHLHLWYLSVSNKKTKEAHYH